MRTVLKSWKLALLFGIGLVLRWQFIAWGSHRLTMFPQEEIFYNGDSYSYIWSFRNWWHLGQYTFDFQQPDAAFGRLPGYPLFYGLHYLLVGPARAGLAIACTQALLDSSAALLVFSSVRRLIKPLDLGAWVPYVGALLYATNPFFILWVPIIGTETLATFLTLAWLAWLLRPARTTGHFVGLGLLLAAAFYVREYLGVLLPITCVYVLASWPAAPVVAHQGRGRVAALLLVCSTFGALYVLWPVRNYAVAHRLVLLKPLTAGYAQYNVDMVSFRSWVLCWSADLPGWRNKVLASGQVTFPADLFASPEEARQARRGAQLAHDCGSSFRLFQLYPMPTAVGFSANEERNALRHNCNTEIEAIFTQLKASYIARHPVRYWFDVPTQNLGRALFKSATTPPANEPPVSWPMMLFRRSLFVWRSLLVVLGMAGLVYYRRQLWPVATFVGFMYFFICVVGRALEMRYLLQADALLLVPATLLLGAVAAWLPAKKTGASE